MGAAAHTDCHRGRHLPCQPCCTVSDVVTPAPCSTSRHTLRLCVQGVRLCDLLTFGNTSQVSRVYHWSLHKQQTRAAIARTCLYACLWQPSHP